MTRPLAQATSNDLAELQFLLEEEKKFAQRNLQPAIGLLPGLLGWVLLNETTRQLAKEYIFLPLTLAILKHLPFENQEEDHDPLIKGFAIADFVLAGYVGYLLYLIRQEYAEFLYQTFPHGGPYIPPLKAKQLLNEHVNNEELTMAIAEVKKQITKHKRFNVVNHIVFGVFMLGSITVFSSDGFSKTAAALSSLAISMLLRPFQLTYHLGKGIINFFSNFNKNKLPAELIQFENNIKTIFSDLGINIKRIESKNRRMAVLTFDLPRGHQINLTINNQEIKVENNSLAQAILKFCETKNLPHYVYEGKLFLVYQHLTEQTAKKLADEFTQGLTEFAKDHGTIKNTLANKNNTIFVTNSLNSNENKQVINQPTHTQKPANGSYTYSVTQKISENMSWALSSVHANGMAFLSHTRDYIFNDINKRVEQFHNSELQNHSHSPRGGN